MDITGKPSSKLGIILGLTHFDRINVRFSS
jgi:hypothetical protein